MTRRWVRAGAAITLSLAVLAVTLSGQGRIVQPSARDTNQTAVGTGTVIGTVRVAGSGSPVRRARVSLAAPELRGGRSTLTDDQGRFVFAALPAGRYTITASKAGFVDTSYGATRPGRPGTPVQLAEGQTLDQLTLGLPRGSVITGVVVDEHGDPAPGTQVRAMRFVMQTGERRLQMAGQDQTDDRGMYRIFQLQPGDYIVSAVPRNTNVGDMRQALAMEIASLRQAVDASGGTAGFALSDDNAGSRRLMMLTQQLEAFSDQAPTSYAPVYYPGTTTPGAAQALSLGAGEERGSVNFRLQLVGTTRVTGLVVTRSGVAPQGTTVALAPRAEGMPEIPGLGNNMARVGADGRFTFDQVAPGDYVLQARANIRAAPAGGNAGGGGGRGRGRGAIVQVLWASANLSVTGQPLPDVVLNLQEGMTVGGSIRFEGGTPPDDLSSVRVMLAPRGHQTFEIGSIPPAVVDASGQFRINGVAPGRYTIAAAIGGAGRIGGRGVAPFAPAAGTGGAGWVLQSAMHNGRDLLDFPVEIGPNQNISGIQLTWSTRTQELSGTIQDTAGRPTSDFTIVVFPASQEYWQPQSRRIVATRPGTDGRFTFPNLPPGNYRLTAVTDVEPGEWFDPAFLTKLSKASLPIALAEGERKVQDIRVAGN